MNPQREDPRTPELEALLEAASRPGALVPAAEERALQAFRTAHEKGVHAAPLRWRRRRDDWRPAGVRRRARSLKALLAGVVAAVALGGVAVAAGEGAISSPFGGGGGGDAEPKPGRSAPTVPGDGEESAGEPRGERAPQRSATPTPSASHESPRQRPGTAPDTIAQCRVYLAAVQRQGKAPRGVAMTALEEAAGSREAVPAYCEQLLAAERQGRTGSTPAAKKSPEHREKPEKKDAPTPTGPGAARPFKTG